MDPAKPWFDLTDDSHRVNKDDADLVDIMHTNSGFLLDVSKISSFKAEFHFCSSCNLLIISVDAACH